MSQLTPPLSDLCWLVLVAIAVGLTIWWCVGPRESAAAVIVWVFAATATWLSFAPDRRFEAEMRSREPLTDEEFFSRFYAGTGVDPDILRRLRPMYGKTFGVDPKRLHPDDRPPLLVELDHADFVLEIEDEFGAVITDKEAEGIEGSFDSVVRFLCERSRVAKQPNPP